MKEILEQIKQNPVYFINLEEKLKMNKEFIKECVFIDARIIFYLNEKFLNDDFFSELYLINKNILRYTLIDGKIDDLLENLEKRVSKLKQN